jgi:phage terminase large subunit GpA-like protein
VSRGKTPDWRDLGTRLAGSHPRGTVPPQAWFLTAGGDVQDDEVYVSVRAWGDQRTSWLVDWYVFERTKGDDGDLIKSDLKQIEEFVLRAVYPVHGGSANPRGRKSLGVALLAIDGNHRTMDVHEWRRSLSDAAKSRVRIVRGESEIKDEQGYKMTVLEHSKRDETVVYEGGLEMWHIAPDPFRTDLQQRFRAMPDRPGAWFVTCDAIDQGEYYLRQVVNEPMVMVRDKSGRWKRAFVQRDSTIGHDFWDCAVYESAAAQMVVDTFPGVPGWDASGWPQPAKPRSGKRPQQAAAVQGRELE